ncbi:MAG: enoyl-CoA hydratase/isomerase family protein [Deltaproteobacteria bacterium]|nr:enoyl-CoA hydratase/isomerase family protein [Deltaproteobacteria bacterium]
MSSFKTIIYEKQENRAYVTLNRPEVLNAYSIQMRDDLYEVLTAIRDDDEIRVAVVKGAGDKAFCAGADLNEFLTASSTIQARQIRFRRDLWKLFLTIPQPLIAALHGYVLGSGMEIAACCDIRIASEDAVFGLPEVGFGIIPGAGGTQTIPRIIGVPRALEMMLTNRWLPSTEAYQYGLVNRVVPRDKLFQTAEEMARHIAALNPQAVTKAKEAVVRGVDLPLAEALSLEKRLASECTVMTADKQRNHIEENK